MLNVTENYLQRHISPYTASSPKHSWKDHSRKIYNSPLYSSPPCKWSIWGNFLTHVTVLEPHRGQNPSRQKPAVNWGQILWDVPVCYSIEYTEITSHIFCVRVCLNISRCVAVLCVPTLCGWRLQCVFIFFFLKRKTFKIFKNGMFQGSTADTS